MNGPLALDVVFFLPFNDGQKKKLYAPYFNKPSITYLIDWLIDFVRTIIVPTNITVSTVNAQKIYGVKPRTEFTIRTLE